MPAASNEDLRTGTPTPADSRLAMESSVKIASAVPARRKAPLSVRIGEGSEESIAIPASAMHLLADILREMGLGNSVMLLARQSELSTQQAAELLNVSRPFLVEQIEKGALPCRKVGTHRRVNVHDLLAYKQRMEQARLQSLEELSAIDQELRLGY